MHHYVLKESKLAVSDQEAIQAVDNMLVSAVSHFEAEQDDE